MQQMITLQALIKSDHGRATKTYLTGSTNSQAEEELTVIHLNCVLFSITKFLSNRT